MTIHLQQYISHPGPPNVTEFITQLRLQSDGKILISTGITSTVSSGRIRRFNSDGTTDTTFEPPGLASNNSSGFSYRLNDFDLLSDGSIIIVGRFDTVNSVSRINIARILPAGNVDLSAFQTGVSSAGESITKITILASGKIMAVVLPPTYINPRILRLNADGTVDNTYNAPNNFEQLSAIKFDAQGRALLTKGVTQNGTTLYQTLRLNADGSLDNYI